MGMFHDQVRDRLIRYARINTRSEANTGRTPFTDNQYDLARVLKDELEEIGVSNVWLDEKNCVVYGTIPSTMPDGKGRSIGYVAHMDTAPDASGTNVRPWVFENYDGSDIVLNKELGIVMRTADYPHLNNYIGQDLVLTDGTTLLGGDDKAAIAALMTAAEYAVKHPELPHGPVQIAFTPDEEVAGLAKDLDLERFGAETAYTIDGDYLGVYSYETFNATEAQLTIRGLSVHPGTAKGIMVNAAEIACEFVGMLPRMDRPELTEGREGFYFPHTISGSVEHAIVHCLIRDFDDVNFEMRKNYIERCVGKLNERYGEGTVTLVFTNGYLSMKHVVDKVPYMVENLKQAIKDCGVEPRELAFRGGTDGSALSQRGLPTPNLSAGYENAHGRFEYVPVQAMEKNVEILLRLWQISAE